MKHLITLCVSIESWLLENKDLLSSDDFTIVASAIEIIEATIIKQQELERS